MFVPKNIILANDLPGIGKVALASSLPIMAVAGLESSLLPTVILSSHTGGIPNLYLSDFTAGSSAFLSQWQSLDDFLFQGLVVGYCRNKQQLTSIQNFIEHQQIKEIIVDPVMADQGRLYQGFDSSYVPAIRNVCQSAKIILPNLTEAALLSETDYLGNDYSQTDIEALLYKLADIGAEHIIVTGVSLSPDKIGFAYYEPASGRISYHQGRKFAEDFYGSGDIVTAIVASSYFNGLDIDRALEIALVFLDKALSSTLQLNRPVKYGIYFEPHLAWLAQALATTKGEENDE